MRTPTLTPKEAAEAARRPLHQHKHMRAASCQMEALNSLQVLVDPTSINAVKEWGSPPLCFKQRGHISTLITFASSPKRQRKLREDSYINIHHTSGAYLMFARKRKTTSEANMKQPILENAYRSLLALSSLFTYSHTVPGFGARTSHEKSGVLYFTFHWRTKRCPREGVTCVLRNQ